MSDDAKYLLYRVTRTEETYPSTGPVHFGLPDLNVRKYPRLKDCHPYFEEELWFDVGQTRTVPLTEAQARRERGQKWEVQRRGHGRPVNDGERRLIAFCEQRHAELGEAHNRVLGFTNPYGDYVRAGLVGRFLKLAQIADDLERLKASGIVTEEVADTMAAVVNRLLDMQADLEGKGWKFAKDGTVWEPSSGGRPARYPRAVIRAHYRQLKLQHMGSGAPWEVVEAIRRNLEPVFGSLSPEEIHKAIRNDLRQEAKPTPPAQERQE